MVSAVNKYSLRVGAHNTSISLERDFWLALGAIALLKGKTRKDVVSEVDASRTQPNLSSALRVFCLQQVMTQEFRDKIKEMQDAVRSDDPKEQRREA